MVRFSAASVTWALLSGGGRWARKNRSLTSRLDPQTATMLRSTLDAAAGDHLPVKALEAKALEAAAKHRPATQIVGVVRQLADRFRRAQSVLAAAAPGSPIAETEILNAAEAMASGVPAAELARLRHDAPAGTSLEIPLAVLGELARRGVPADQAGDVIGGLLSRKVPETRIIEIPARMDVGVCQGAPPLAALGYALLGLALPLPPSFPRPRGRRYP